MSLLKYSILLVIRGLKGYHLVREKYFSLIYAVYFLQSDMVMEFMHCIATYSVDLQNKRKTVLQKGPLPGFWKQIIPHTLQNILL